MGEVSPWQICVGALDRRLQQRDRIGALATFAGALGLDEIGSADHLADAHLGVLEGHAFGLGDHVKDAVALLDAGAERLRLLRVPAPIVGAAVLRVGAGDVRPAAAPVDAEAVQDRFLVTLDRRFDVLANREA